MEDHDPNVIIQSANDKLASNDLEGGQMVFQSALLTWVDDARESGGGDESLQEAIATLWLAYAQFLIRAKQFKSATEAYEQAVSCSVARNVGRVWLEYARFAEERGKLKTAQNIYMRAFKDIHDEQDQALLWNEFLDMMRKSNPELSLKELQQAVEQESPLVEPILPHSVESSSSLVPPAKRFKMEHSTESEMTHVVTSDDVQLEAKAFTELLQQPNDMIMHEWTSRDGGGLAQPPEPPLFGPSPPKLSDPTAKDILGPQLSLQLIQRLLSPSGKLILETCRALWSLQALKEKEANMAISRFDSQMLEAMKQKDADLEARLVSAMDASRRQMVEQVNESERSMFQHGVSQQRQSLLSDVAWEFRRLLCVQQQILAKLKVPSFEDGPTVDASALELQSKVCSYLHSAFYLRSRIGDDAHIGMLKNQVTKLERELESGRIAGTSPAPPPNRLSPVPPLPLYQQPPVQALPPITSQPQQLPVYGYQQQEQPLGAGGMPMYGYPQMMPPMQPQVLPMQLPPYPGYPLQQQPPAPYPPQYYQQ